VFLVSSRTEVRFEFGGPEGPNSYISKRHFVFFAEMKVYKSTLCSYKGWVLLVWVTMIFYSRRQQSQYHLLVLMTKILMLRGNQGTNATEHYVLLRWPTSHCLLHRILHYCKVLGRKCVFWDVLNPQVRACQVLLLVSIPQIGAKRILVGLWLANHLLASCYLLKMINFVSIFGTASIEGESFCRRWSWLNMQDYV
jgi:hypothetical protein